jgi:RTA1 like protein.
MVLGRIIRYLHAEHFSLVPLKWLTGIFVTGDVIAFVAQAVGMHTRSYWQKLDIECLLS